VLSVNHHIIINGVPEVAFEKSSNEGSTAVVKLFHPSSSFILVAAQGPLLSARHALLRWPVGARAPEEAKGDRILSMLKSLGGFSCAGLAPGFTRPGEGKRLL